MFNKLIPWKRHNESQNQNLSVRKEDDPFTILRRDFDSLLARFWDEGSLGGMRGGVDLDEDEDEYKR